MSISKPRASSASRWSICSASHQMEQAAEAADLSIKYDSKASTIGTDCHTAVELMIKGAFPDAIKQAKDRLPKDAVQMVDAAYRCWDGLYAKKQFRIITQEGLLENDYMTGHSDLIAYDSDTLLILDFKFGYINVEAENNAQLLAYAYMAMDKFPEARRAKVRLVIIQPKSKHPVKEWDLSAAEVRTRGAKIMDQAKKAMDTSLLDLNCVPAACRYCKARLICPEFQKQSLIDGGTTMKLLTQDEIQEIRDGLGDLRERALLAASLKDAIDTYVLGQFREGKSMPKGLEVIAGRGRRKWIDEEAVRDQLEVEYGDTPSLYMEAEKLKSPAKLEKDLPIAEDLIEQNVEMDYGRERVVNVRKGRNSD